MTMQSDHPAVNHLRNALSAIVDAKDWPAYDSIVVDVFLVIQAANERMQRSRYRFRSLADHKQARRRMVDRDDSDQELEEMPVWVPEA